MKSMTKPDCDTFKQVSKLSDMDGPARADCPPASDKISRDNGRKDGH